MNDFAALYAEIKLGNPASEVRLRHLQAYGDSQLRLVGRALSILWRITQGQGETLLLSSLLGHLQNDMQPQARLPEVRFYVQLVRAELLMQLGQTEQALRAVSAAMADNELADPQLRQRVFELYSAARNQVGNQVSSQIESAAAQQSNVQPDSAQLGWTQAWLAKPLEPSRKRELLLGQLSGPLHENGDTAWTAEEKLLGLLGQITALPAAKQGESAVRQLVRSSLMTPESCFKDHELTRWARMLGHLLLGELGLALRISSAQPGETSPLWKTLSLAAALETLIRAVQWDSPRLDGAEEAFLRAFGELAQLTANAGQEPQELAQLIWRWHPVTAVYLACLPEAPGEFLFARSSVLTVGARSSAYGLTLPPAYAGEMILRSFGLGHERSPLAQAPLSSRMRAQRGRLEIQYGSIKLWRPVVSSMLIACAYMRHGAATHAAAARQLLREFGTIPAFRTEYMHGELERLEALVRNVVAGETTRGTLQIDRIR